MSGMAQNILNIARKCKNLEKSNHEKIKYKELT